MINKLVKWFADRQMIPIAHDTISWTDSRGRSRVVSEVHVVFYISRNGKRTGYKLKRLYKSQGFSSKIPSHRYYKEVLVPWKLQIGWAAGSFDPAGKVKRLVKICYNETDK